METGRCSPIQDGPAARPGEHGITSVRASPQREITLVHVTTIPATLFFLSGQASSFHRCGYSVHAISSPGPLLGEFAKNEGVFVHAVEMSRSITPLRDIRALWQLWHTLRVIRPDIVHAHTPKAGLLGMLAAWLTRTPARVYHMHGTPLATATGLRRLLLSLAEATSCLLAHRVLAVSRSTRTLAIEKGICRPERIKVLLSGSINGIDALGRFRPLGESVRRCSRDEQRIPQDALVVGFVGRLTREKGVAELASAWQRLRELDSRIHLLLVGPVEKEDPLPESVIATLQSDPRVRLMGFDLNTPRLYAAMDVVALPTYREGLPTVALEAGAMALPIVATKVTGCVDAVLDGVTGTLVEARDVTSLTEALRNYLFAPAMRMKHGEAGRRRVLAEFRPEPMWQAVAAEYRHLLSACSGSGCANLPTR